MKEFFDALYSMRTVERRDLLEKDYHLHRMLAAEARVTCSKKDTFPKIDISRLYSAIF